MNFTNQNVFKFERKRLGNKTLSPHYEKYGPYLYRNTINNILIASWEKPEKELHCLYTGEEIGYNIDALKYYKNV